MSKMKNWMMEEEEKFWSTASSVCGESESCAEFVSTMMAKPEVESVIALSGTGFDSGLTPWIDSKELLVEQLEDSWDEFWSKYM
tara:strand:+ start:345 stop:596 length:252 start_codon:yes stop_codon:yes gene_type:complete